MGQSTLIAPGAIVLGEIIGAPAAALARCCALSWALARCGARRELRLRTMAADVVSLNACLLPSHLRWIFRAHRGLESLDTATARVGAALAEHAARRAVDVVHVQELYAPQSHAQLAAHMRAAGFAHASPHARCGVASFARVPLAVLHTREYPRPPFTPKGWRALAVGGGGAPGPPPEVHLNVHLASEIDGSRRARLAQAREIGAWVRGALLGEALAGARAARRVLVIGDLNEPDPAAAAELARALGALAPPDVSAAAAAMAAESSYSWLGGLVRGRMDRAFLLDARPRADGRGAAGGGVLEVCGRELGGAVLTELADVSDHYALHFELGPAAPLLRPQPE